VYEAVQLANGLKVLFVHDEKEEKAACSISVGVGSLRDGERSLGLAHFLEHMLFMGSRKFPRHNEYS
jgi:secreted Zn-dependent insulinase-like peptidase